MKYHQRIIALKTSEQVNLAISAIKNAPLDLNLEVVIRETKKQRSLDANAAYWAALNDISIQAWMNGKQYSPEIWHIYCRQQFMPDENTDPYIHEHVMEKELGSYHKYEYLPNGERQCVASTTQLTKYGFSEYLTQVFALGGSLGVQFTAKEQK